ncbi:MAG: hypothetical protein WC637_00210 [Victivallales bacterium]|jgi:hypothetical protein
MINPEFINFMQELVMAPDSVIKKAHMERMFLIIRRLQAEANINMAEICKLRGQVEKLKRIMTSHAAVCRGWFGENEEWESEVFPKEDQCVD